MLFSSSMLFLACGKQTTATQVNSSSLSLSSSSSAATTSGNVIDLGGSMKGLPIGFYVSKATPVQSYGVGTFTLGNSGNCQTTDSGNSWQESSGFAQSYTIQDSVLSIGQNGSLRLYRSGSGQGILGLWNYKDSTGRVRYMRWYTQDTMFTLYPNTFIQDKYTTTYVGTGSTAQFNADGSMTTPYQGNTFREVDSVIVSNGHLVGGKTALSWGSKLCSGQFLAKNSAASCTAGWSADSAFAQCVKSLVPNHPAPVFCAVYVPIGSLCGTDCVNISVSASCN